MGEKKYFKKIDGLRFVAISFVLLEHFAMFLGRPIYAGFYGVDLFFVISGFLITNILIQNNKNSFDKNYIGFIGRRTIRIFPLYYLVIFLLWFLENPIVRDNFIYLLTYTFNYAMVFNNLPASPAGHLWSLSIEEQFYLFWPIIVISLKNRIRLLIIIILIIILMSYAQFSFNIFPRMTVYNYYGLFTRMGSLCLGALGAVLAFNKLLPEKVFRNKFLEYFMLLALLITLIFPFQLKMFFLGVCSFYLVLKAAYFDFSITLLNKFLLNKHVIYIGTISYGIYIYHAIIGYYLSIYFVDPLWASINFDELGKFEKIRWHIWLIKFPIFTALSLLVAAISFKYMEKPLLRLKDKYFKK